MYEESNAPSPEMWFQRGREIEGLLLRGPFGPADTCGIHATAAGFGKLAFEGVDAGGSVAAAASSEEGDTDSDMPKETTVVQEPGVNSTIPTPTVSESVQNMTESETREETSPPAPETTSTTTTTTQPSPTPNPTTQESFFKSVNKRLQMLESNSTLSLLYIEEQSRILRTAFNKVERRQLTKTSTFLEHLNETVLSELKQFREQYDLVWKSVVLEFESQRVLHQREMYAVSGQLGVLADELVFQKRVAVVQSLMVLVCFGVILFSSRSCGGIDLQNMVSRSAYATHVRSSSSTFESPVSASPSSTGHSRHQRNVSDDSRGDDADADGRDDNGVPSPTIAYEPPTPTSPSDEGDDGNADHDGGGDGDVLTMPAVESHVRSRSSPPVLKGADEDEDGRSSGS